MAREDGIEGANSDDKVFKAYERLDDAKKQGASPAELQHMYEEESAKLSKAQEKEKLGSRFQSWILGKTHDEEARDFRSDSENGEQGEQGEEVGDESGVEYSLEKLREFKKSWHGSFGKIRQYLTPEEDDTVREQIRVAKTSEDFQAIDKKHKELRQLVESRKAVVTPTDQPSVESPYPQSDESSVETSSDSVPTEASTDEINESEEVWLQRLLKMSPEERRAEERRMRERIKESEPLAQSPTNPSSKQTPFFEPVVATAKDFISGRIEGARVVAAVANQHYRSNGAGGFDIQDPGHDITIETEDGKQETVSIPPGFDLKTLNSAIQQKKGPDASRVLEAVYREKERLAGFVVSAAPPPIPPNAPPAAPPVAPPGSPPPPRVPPIPPIPPQPGPRPIPPTPEPARGIPLDNAILKGLQDDIAWLKEKFKGKPAPAEEEPADIAALKRQINKTKLENDLATLKVQGQKTGQETVEGFMKGVRELTDKSHYERAYEALKLERGRENMSEFEKLGYIRSQAKISEAWNNAFPAWSRIALTAGILGAGLFATNVIAPALAGVCGLATIVWKGIFGATAGAAIGALTERHRMKTKRSNPTFWGGIATILATLVTMGTTIDIQKLR